MSYKSEYLCESFARYWNKLQPNRRRTRLSSLTRLICDRKSPYFYFLSGTAAESDVDSQFPAKIQSIYFPPAPLALISSPEFHFPSLPVAVTSLYPGVSDSCGSPNFLSISFLCVNSLKSIMRHTDSLLSWKKKHYQSRGV